MTRALREVVRRGDVAVDLGAGTGILGFMALKAGAARVYAIEQNPIIKLARVLAAENGFNGRVRFFHGDSRRVRLPERADLVLVDFVSHLGVDGEIYEPLLDARRFLKRGGRFVPERSEVWVAPVRAPEYYRSHVKAGKGHGVRLDALHTLAANEIGFFSGMPRKILAPLRRAAVFDLSGNKPLYPQRARFVFRVPGGTIHGLVAATSVRFSPSVRAGEKLGESWNPVYLPIAEPLKARPGERIPVELTLHGPGTVEWSVGDRRQSNLFESYIDGR